LVQPPTRKAFLSLESWIPSIFPLKLIEVVRCAASLRRLKGRVFLEGTGVSVPKLKTLVLFDVERDVVFWLGQSKGKSSKFELHVAMVDWWFWIW